jgi:dTDP-4-dehydrorhamnose 3,5-epimerase
LIFVETKLKGAYIVELEKREDHRGFFARSWDGNVLEQHGLIGRVVQQNIAFSKFKGTIRGLHYQKAPHQETKFVRCTRGAVYDVIVDLRPDSPTLKQWLGIKMTADEYKLLYVPKDFAQGFQSLDDNSEIQYLVSAVYTPAAEAGIRYNDPNIGIEWPLPVSMITEKDANLPDFSG